MLTHRHILVNGLETFACSVAQVTGRRYVVKVVGDSVWETARNAGRTHLPIGAFQSHDCIEFQTPRRARARWLSRAAAIITPSQYLADLVRDWGTHAARIHVVHNGVTRDHRGEPKAIARRTTDPLRLVFCGRLTNWKGVETLILALRGLPQVHLDVIGDGPESPMLRSICNHVGLDARVVWHGRLDGERLERTLAAGHAAVLVSGYEGLSHTLLEAAHHGLALIASDCGGNPEVVQDGHNGILVSYGDTTGLRQAIETLHSNEDLRYRLARQAQQTAAQFDFEQTVSQTIEILQKGHV
jgi:glycosyltransferase involved in cell wall biosynthesis